MKPKSEAAYLVRSVPYRDSDLIVTILTSGSGVVSLMARGAKKSRKRFGGALDFAKLFRAEYAAPREAGLGTLSSVELLCDFPKTVSDIRRYAVASHFVEVVRGLAREGEVSGEPFSLLDGGFRGLEAGGDPVSLLRVFQVRAVSLMGYSIAASPCGACGETLSEESTSLSGSVLYCASCAPQGSARISAGAVKTLRSASSLDFSSLGSLRISKKTEEEIGGFVEKALVRALGGEPKSLGQLHQFLSIDL